MFLPENIDLSQSESYDLSIRLTPDGFSFCIYSADDPSVFHYQETGLGSKFSHTQNIKRLIFDLGFFSQPFHCTKVTVVSPRYTLIPDIFFDKKKAKELFQYNFHPTNGLVLIDPASETYHVVYHVDEEVHSFLSRSLWNPVFRHHASSLLPLFNAHAAKSEGRKCFVDFHDKFVSIACFDGGRLLSSNMFPATHPLDTLYYIVNIWEKLAFRQSSDPFLLGRPGFSTQRGRGVKRADSACGTDAPGTHGNPHRGTTTRIAHRYTCHAMRIISGKYKSRRITVPTNLKARPTTDFAREGLFNVLNNLLDWEETTALDLFSGTGSIAFELISRGCPHVVSVEQNPNHFNFICRTQETLGTKELFPIKADVFKYLPSVKQQFDLVFADPPYDLREAGKIPGIVIDKKLVKEGGLFIMEHSKNHSYAHLPHFKEERKYGNVHFSFFEF